MDYEKAENLATRGINADAALNVQYAKAAQCSSAREMTVGELLDRRIEKAERQLRALTDLKGSLPGNYLNSGASRISSFLEL